MVTKFTPFFITIFIGMAIAQKRDIKINYQFDDSMDGQIRQSAQRRTEKYLSQNIDSKDLTEFLQNDLTREFGQKVTVAINENNRAFGSHLIWDMIISFRSREELDIWWDGQG